MHYNVYVDDLKLKLQNSNIACHVTNECVYSLSYADDMVLLIPTVVALQNLVSICNEYANPHDIIY